MHHYLVSNIIRQYGYVYKIICFISVLRYLANTVLFSYYLFFSLGYVRTPTVRRGLVSPKIGVENIKN